MQHDHHDMEHTHHNHHEVRDHPAAVHDHTGHHHDMKPAHHHEMHDHHGHHAHMVEDFRNRFRISLILSIPVLILSPMIQQFFGLGEKIRFNGDLYISFIQNR